VTDSFHEIDDLQRRLNTLIERADLGDDARELASESLEELAVVIEELQAQNAELIANRQALDVEERRYRDLFEAVPDGYLITAHDGIIREINSAACSLFGRTRDQMIGAPLARYIEAADRRAFYTHLNRIGHADAGGHLAIDLAVHDHSTIPVNLRATQAASRPDGGSEIRWLMRDRRHDMVSEALRVSEERLRATFETARVGIMLCDTDGEILFVNEYADVVLGRGRSDTTSAAWLRTTHPDDLLAVETMLRDVCEVGKSGSIRHRLVHRNGELRWVDHSVAPFRDTDNDLIGFVSTMIDVTTEQQMITDLADSHNFTAALLDTVGALVVVIDPDGRILIFNKTCESVTGFSADDMIGRSLVDALIPLEQRDDVVAVMSELHTASMNSHENDWVTADGRRRTISWTNTNLIGPDGSVTAMIGTGIDVTDSKLVETRLAQADRLAAVGRLTAGIAHDFNNTLATLRLRLDRLEARDLDDDSRADVDAATTTIERAQTLIGDLLTFSSHRRLAETLVDLNAETRRLAPVLSELVGGDIEVTLDLTDADPMVRIDSARLDSVLTNLAINARDAMPGGGRLTITTTVHSIDPYRAVDVRVPNQLAPGDYVVMSVADTGVGITADDLPHIFDPYFTTKPPGRGIGLGLATTYGTVSQSGGAILVESQPGSGSNFHIWLPSVEPGDTSSSDVTTERKPATGVEAGVVLVVDDDDDIRRAVADELTRRGYRTLTAANGAAALERIDTPIDVLVTDVQLPDIDGVQVADRFHSRRQGLVVVYISGASGTRLGALLPAGAVLLRKPFSADDLIAVVRNPGASRQGDDR
jgi:two-component system cell cycle sensor histidine kinase/response regulator CckA